VCAESKDELETDVVKGGAKLRTRDAKVRLFAKARCSPSDGVRILIVYTGKMLRSQRFD
jgi:hypothetical protein